MSNEPQAQNMENPSHNNSTKNQTTANRTATSDKWTKLQSLKALYDEGFITVTEYKDRKSQLVDDITGTSTTQSSMGRGPVARRVRQEFVPPRPPNFEGVVPEKAVAYSFDTKTGEWHQEMIRVKIEKEPFARGGLRKAYHLEYVQEQEEQGGPAKTVIGKTPTSQKQTYVAKISVDPYEDREVYFADVEMQMYAREWSLRFNKYNPPKPIEFIKAAVVQLVEREGSPLCGVERFIDGPYHKHNNNYGFVSEDDRNTPQAFSHFTYEASNHSVLICDIQGVGDMYTDPQVHTRDGIGFGKGNLGMKGFEKFLSTHRCNGICKYFRLPSVNEKVDDKGTVPQVASVKTYTVQTYDVVEYQYNQFGSKIPASALMPNQRTPLLQTPPAQPRRNEGCCVIL